MARLEVRLLGAFQVKLDGELVTHFATDKARALLSYLVVEVAYPHRRDTLAGLLWPDQPQRRARQNLRQALSHLRQAIEKDEATDFLLVTRGTVQFNLESDYWLDVAAFTDLYEVTKQHRHRGIGACRLCLQHLEAMLALYHGEFMKGFFLGDSNSFEEWMLLKREWYHLHIVEALTILARYYVRRGDYAQAREYASRQVAMEPWREETHRLLMHMFALAGERSAALRQYQKCREILAEELNVEPTSETVALFEHIRAGEMGRDRMRGVDTSSLFFPQVSNLSSVHTSTSFVGRDKNLAALHDLLANPECRLLTLVGPGGIGKSRLALRVAEEQVGLFAHGVVIVPLTTANSRELLVTALADALNISVHVQNLELQILEYVRDKAMLLVLDNFEQLLSSVAVLDTLLQAAPGVVMLVTSRERLNLRQEWIYVVEGLAYPPDMDFEDRVTYSAMELFEHRAVQVNSHFSLDAENLSWVVRICQLVEGLPLAVELAAALVPWRPCKAIAQEIAHNLDVLTTRFHNLPARHRSIRAAFEHSWQLLSAAEQALFARLSMFEGGFDMVAAREIAGASTAMLASLLDKSLIRRVSEHRYDIHELLRQYAAEVLEADRASFMQSVERYVGYFSDFLERQECNFGGKRQNKSLENIALEIGNARCAWSFAVSNGWSASVEQSVESLYLFYRIRGRFEEGIALFSQVIVYWMPELKDKLRISAEVLARFRELERALAGPSCEIKVGQVLDDLLLPTRVVGKVLARVGVFYLYQGQAQPAQFYLEQALHVAELIKDPVEEVFALTYLADLIMDSLGDYDHSITLLERAQSIAEQTNNDWGIIRTLYLIGLAKYRQGQIDQGEIWVRQALAAARSYQNYQCILYPLNALGDIVCHRGDYAKAQPLFEECLMLGRELGDQYSIAVQLNNLGTILHMLEKYEEARQAYLESSRICRDIGDQRGLATALSNLGEVAYVLGSYDDAWMLCQEGLTLGRMMRDMWSVIHCLNNLGQVACVLEDYHSAKIYLAEALEITYQTQTLPVLCKVLVNLACFFNEQERETLAATLLAWVYHQPASEQATRERAKHLMDEFGLALPPHGDVALDDMVEEVLQSLRSLDVRLAT